MLIFNIMCAIILIGLMVYAFLRKRILKNESPTDDECCCQSSAVNAECQDQANDVCQCRH